MTQREDSSTVSSPRALVRGLADGDLVSLHWDWVCDRLDADRVAALQHWSHAGITTLELR